jgi:hypothetical protein
MMNEGVNDMTAYTYAEELFSDFHKDAYGFRPRGHEFYTATPARKQEIWDNVQQAFLQRQVEEAEEEARALREFEAEIASIIEAGAGDRTTALRWMTEEDTFYHSQDIEHWVYNQGILFTDAGRALVEELKSIVTISDWRE